jgi:SAM-dependent methyltransferase
VPIAHPLEWKDNLYWKQIGFYTKELRICSFNLRHTHMRQRLDEFYESYHNYTWLHGYQSPTGAKGLGRLIEFGAGGYTQTRNLLEHVDIPVEHVTLVDPLIWPYGKLEGCSYRGGTLRVNNTAYPTSLFNTSTEIFGKRFLGEGVLNQTPLDHHVANITQFDTVIVMNVLVYSANAFEFLETIYRVLKPGGLLLFHDRYFLDMVQSSKCKTAGFQSHMIQVKKEFLDFFLGHFEPQPFLNSQQNSLQKDRSMGWCGGGDHEIGYFAAVQKKL